MEGRSLDIPGKVEFSTECHEHPGGVPRQAVPAMESGVEGETRERAWDGGGDLVSPLPRSNGKGGRKARRDYGAGRIGRKSGRTWQPRRARKRKRENVSVTPRIATAGTQVRSSENGKGISQARPRVDEVHEGPLDLLRFVGDVGRHGRQPRWKERVGAQSASPFVPLRSLVPFAELAGRTIPEKATMGHDGERPRSCHVGMVCGWEVPGRVSSQRRRFCRLMVGNEWECASSRPKGRHECGSRRSRGQL